ncbi:hypothetical protein L9F63_003691, partial [Diploptera punctata]
DRELEPHNYIMLIILRQTSLVHSANMAQPFDTSNFNTYNYIGSSMKFRYNYDKKIGRTWNIHCKKFSSPDKMETNTNKTSLIFFLNLNVVCLIQYQYNAEQVHLLREKLELCNKDGAHAT